VVIAAFLSLFILLKLNSTDVVSTVRILFEFTDELRTVAVYPLDESFLKLQKHGENTHLLLLIDILEQKY
jgi:hypothetical protein